MMKFTENIDLSQFSFMKIGGTGKFLAEIENDSQIKELNDLRKVHNLPVVLVGEGSNTIFNDNKHDKIFVQFKQKDIIKLYENDRNINVKVSAGLNWDKFVDWSVQNGLSGIEKMSGIPGTVGASPIQNIGAYGQEVKGVITYVEVYEFETGKFYEIPSSECNFSYRNSIFKENLGKFAIVNVAFILNKREPDFPNYKDLSLYFLEKQNKKPSLKEIREAVLEIRSSKLPDWKKEPNCGSFFKNPVVTNAEAEKLLEKYPEMPQFKAESGYTKLSGGWLIEKVGLKGETINNIKIHPKSGLVLINAGGASFQDLEKTIEEINGKIEKSFGLVLEVEPNLIK